MRTVKYKTHWSYLGPGIKKENTLAEFLLDVLYLMERHGVVPPLHVLNEVLRTGGSNGGMGPGTTWRGFKISEVEYAELVDALLAMNIAQARKEHPYVMFERIIIDEELNNASTYSEWLRRLGEKYRPR
jgi:hypothetical protein